MSYRSLGLRGQDAWRRHPIFKWTWFDALPGIREGTGAFIALVVAEKTYAWLNPPADDHHQHHDSAHAGHDNAAHHHDELSQTTKTNAAHH